jgi:hypothetical protein
MFYISIGGHAIFDYGHVSITNRKRVLVDEGAVQSMKAKSKVGKYFLSSKIIHVPPEQPLAHSSLAAILE